MHLCNPNNWENEPEGLWVQGQNGYIGKPYLKEMNENKTVKTLCMLFYSFKCIYKLLVKFDVFAIR